MELTQHEKRFCSLCHQVFGTPQGIEVMKYLDDRYEQPVARPNLNSNFAYYREGENNLIRWIRTSIKQHIINSRGKNDRNDTDDTDGK